MSTRYWLVAATAIAAFVSTTVVHSAGAPTQKQARLQSIAVTAKPAAERRVSRLIVKLRDSEANAGRQGDRGLRVVDLAAAAGVGLSHVRDVAGGASLVALESGGLPLSQAKAMAALLAADPRVEYAEPDVLLKKLATPTDSGFARWQWNLFAPTSIFEGRLISSSATKSALATGGANLPPAWDFTTGSTSTVVAVIDTGIVNHPDLNGLANPAPYIPGGRFLSGYDFVSSDVGAAGGLPSNFVANDGNGRDADPTDPGDWVTVTEETRFPDACDDGVAGGQDSSWHGTHMAGIVAASANNNIGIAGVGWNVRVLPIRALGKCGGSLVDIGEAIRWAAGLAVPGVPTNMTPARVISLSLGGPDPCSPHMQAAVDAAVAAGAVVIAASGNEGSLSLVSPASCTGVIAVTGHTILGENADYANIGTGVAISAPGGGSPVQLGTGGPTDDDGWTGYYIWSTVLFGATTPGSADARGDTGAAYTGFEGTSAAAPQVAGAAALLATVVPSATPAQIRAFLVTNVRPFPAGGACAAGGAFAGLCGAGLLDVGAAVAAAAPSSVPPVGGGGGALPLGQLLLLVALLAGARLRRRE
jgi:serine protease